VLAPLSHIFKVTSVLAPLSHILSSLSGVSLPCEGLQSLLTPNYVIVTVARRIGSKWYLSCSRRQNRCSRAQTEADKGYRSRRVDATQRSCSIFEVVNVRRSRCRSSIDNRHSCCISTKTNSFNRKIDILSVIVSRFVFIDSHYFAVTPNIVITI